MKKLHGNNFLSKSVQILLYVILILNYSIVKEQVVNNGNLFIDSNAAMNINSVQFIFNNNATTITTKSNLLNSSI